MDINAVIGASAVPMVFSAILSIVGLVFRWMTYAKMDEAGWKSIVPIYNEYVLCRRCWTKKGFIFGLISAIIGIIGASIMTIGLPSFMATNEMNVLVSVGMVILSIGGIMSFVYTVMSFVKVSHAFDCSGAMAIVGVLFVAVFWGLLALTECDYEGNPCGEWAVAEENEEDDAE